MQPSDSGLPPEPPTVLEATVVEIERHVAHEGWDQPPKLFALVETADLLAREPQLAGELGVAAGEVLPGSLTPVEQEAIDEMPLDDLLAQIEWPREVLGCALVHEALVLPPEADAQRPDNGDAVTWAQNHPDRREVRMAVGVLRDGQRAGTLRVRAAGMDGDDDVLVGPDLVPDLTAALLATLDVG